MSLVLVRSWKGQGYKFCNSNRVCLHPQCLLCMFAVNKCHQCAHQTPQAGIYITFQDFFSVGISMGIVGSLLQFLGCNFWWRTNKNQRICSFKHQPEITQWSESVCIQCLSIIKIQGLSNWEIKCENAVVTTGSANTANTNLGYRFWYRTKAFVILFCCVQQLPWQHCTRRAFRMPNLIKRFLNLTAYLCFVVFFFLILFRKGMGKKMMK